MRALLPPFVAVRETGDVVPWLRGLLGDENQEVAHAVMSRRHQFEMGRSLARAAMAQLGEPPVPILCGARREPLWPSGIVGSITHCSTYGAVAVARRDRVRTIGIDVEVRGRVSEDLIDFISTPAERSQQRVTGPDWPTALFAAKEAVYKAWYPVHCTGLGIEEVDVVLDLGEERFRVEVACAEDAAFSTLHGRIRIGPRLVSAAVVVVEDQDSSSLSRS